MEGTMVPKIPEGYTPVTPYLVVPGAAKVLEFAEKAFGAKVLERFATPDGVLRHAVFSIGGAKMMIGDADGARWGARPGCVYLYVDDCDATYRRALAAGAESLMEPADQFYGDRNAGVKDAAGDLWWIATHVEDVSPEELARRAAAHREA